MGLGIDDEWKGSMPKISRVEKSIAGHTADDIVDSASTGSIVDTENITDSTGPNSLISSTCDEEGSKLIGFGGSASTNGCDVCSGIPSTGDAKSVLTDAKAESSGIASRSDDADAASDVNGGSVGTSSSFSPS